MLPGSPATGSVYLDVAPRPGRRPPVPRVDVRRVRVAAALGGVALLTLAVAAVLWGVRTLLLEPTPFVEAFETALDDPALRAELEEELALGIQDHLVGPELMEIAAAYELDVPAEAARISGPLLDDPTVRSELTIVVEELHREAFVGASPTGVDLSGLTDAVLAVVERESPRLASIIPEGVTIWAIDGSTMPDLTAVSDATSHVGLFVIVGMGVLAGAAVIHPRHHRVVDWGGRAAVGAAVLGAVVAVGLPFAARELTGLDVVESVVRSTTMRLLAPAGLTAFVGALMLAVAGVARHREKRKVLDEGAAAALGGNEPPLWRQASSPELDLARRGLVDAGQRLTNI